MVRRTRALIGAFVIVGFVIAYALLAMSLAQAPALLHASALIQGLAYAALGLAWVIPLMPLIRWMERRDRA